MSFCRFILTSALWAVILAASILGRLITTSSHSSNSDRIIVDQNPILNREQAKEWKDEFFGSTSTSFTSTARRSRFIDDLDQDPPPLLTQLASSESSYNNGRFQRGFGTMMATGHVDDGPLNYFSKRLSGSRNYNTSSIHIEQQQQQPKIKVENLEWMLKNIFTYPRSHVTNETAKEIVVKYIRDSLHITSGLPTKVQQFEPLQFLTMYEGSTVPTGTNIIGVIKGTEWSTGRDKPIVIGAHYDTVNFTPGTDDNGSGVAAMLETARTIAHSDCKPKYSIIFVAFDLEEVGSQGSLVFIKDYLAKLLNSNFPNDLGYSTKFQGAFIMDTIMDFNETEDSQTFPTDWSLAVPEVYEEVANENYRGDFLSMIYRRGIDNRMTDLFNYHWLLSKHDSKFRLKGFPLYLSEELPDLQVLSDHLNFLRSDHARFWYMNDTEVPYTLHAVLMTDTGPYRGNMRHCYHSLCDGPEVSIHDNPENLKFLEKITQVLTDTVLDMSECENSKYSSSTHAEHSASLSNNYLLKRNNAPPSSTRSSSRRNLSPSLLQDINNIVKLIHKYS